MSIGMIVWRAAGMLSRCVMPPRVRPGSASRTDEVERVAVPYLTPPCCSRNALSRFTSSGYDERPMIVLN